MAKRAWVMTNSGAIAVGAFWYPLTESTSPTQYQISNYLPFRSAIIENRSGEPFTVVLDPIVGSSTKEYRVTDGQTLTIPHEDNVTFYQLLLINAGALETAIGEMKVSVRNY